MKKNIYSLLDEITEQYVPDNFDTIMQKIEKISLDEASTETQMLLPEKKKRPFLRYSAISGAAACLIIFLSVFIIKQNQNTLPIIDNHTFTTNTSEELPTVSNSGVGDNVQISSHPQNQDSVEESDSPIQNENYFNIPTFIVFNHNFYRITENEISNADLDKQYTTTVNGGTIINYSLKGQSVDTGIALKIGNMYRYYEYIYNGIISFGSKRYGLSEQLVTQEKGKYLGTVDGLKLFEIVGNDTALLVDMASVINLDGSECLYVAALIE